MLQNRFFIIFLIFFTIIISGCKLKPVEFKNIGGFEVLGIEDNSAIIKVTATINNPNPRIKIKNSEVFVSLNNKEIGKITQLDKIILEGKSAQKYSTRLRIELTEGKGGMFSALSLLNNSKKNLKLTGKAKVSMRLYWKTYTIKDYPVKL